MTTRHPSRGNSPTAIVLGGGLAGIAASARLAEAGWDVTLLEARKSLGGRAFSFRDPGDFRDPDGDEDDIDNGQHVIVGACRNLIDFLTQIGIWDSWRLQSRLDVAIYDRGGRLGRLYGVNLRPPAHLLPAFLTYPHLGLWDKMRAIRGLIAAMFARRNDANVENITFYHWLRAHGQSERTIYNLWNVLIEGTLNDNIRDVSAAMGLLIVQDGLLDGRQDANIGYPKVALGDAIGEPARRHLESLGVHLWLGCPVRRINADGENAVSSITIGNGQTLSADAYVSALPFWVLPNLLPESLLALEPFPSLLTLQTSPIVNVHLQYDTPVMSRDFCYFVDSPLQWVFNRSVIRGQTHDDTSQFLTVSISAAWEYIDTDRSELAATIAAEIRRAFPSARHATLLRATVVKQPNATFRCTPGANRLRPGPVTPAPNLFLAGEWTRTGWPSTMESAVISGYNAAAAVIASASPHEDPFGA